jgi:hypothetical protein
MRKASRAVLAAVAAFSLSAPAPAEEPRIKDLVPAPPSKAAKPKPAPPSVDLIEFYLSGEVLHDSNVNHLLINSNIDSTIRIPDEAFHSAAGVTANPLRGEGLRTSLSYSYDRYDYRRHDVLSYQDHGASAVLQPRLFDRTRLELGADVDWIGDASGPIATTQSGRAGLLWVEPGLLRLRAGLSFEKNVVFVNSLKNSRSPMLYATAYWRFAPRQTAVLAYEGRDSRAKGSNFSYRSHWLKLGLVNGWSSIFKVAWSAAYTWKDYASVDDRFLVRRRDGTLSLKAKPTLTLLSGLDLFGAVAYSRNRSNVSFKDYVDVISSAGLEARF